MADKITIKIDGIGPVQVDAGFKDLSAEDQQRTVNEIHSAFMAKQEQPSMLDTAVDTAKSFGSGVVNAALDLAETPQMLGGLAAKGIEKGYSAATGQDLPENIVTGMQLGLGATPSPRGAVEAVAPIVDYETQTTAGDYGRTVGEFLPTALGGGTRAAISYGVLPALASETAGQMTEGTRAEPFARLAAAVLTPTGEKALMRLISPAGGRLDDQHVKAVELLAKEGVIPTAGQRTGQEATMYMEDATEAGRQLVETARENFTRAALKRVGIDSTRATPDVLQEATDRLSGIYANTIRAAESQAQKGDFKDAFKVVSKLRSNSTDGVPEAFNKIVQQVRRSVKNGKPMNGVQLQNAHSNMSALSTQGGPVGVAAREMKDFLEGLVSRGLPPEASQQWAQARKEWRNLFAVQKALEVGEAGKKGIITPQRLDVATRQIFGGKSNVMAKSELGELARAGSLVMKTLPNSGTQSRLKAAGQAASVGAGPTTGMGGLAMGLDPQTAAGVGVAGAFAPRAMNQFVASPLGQKYMANQRVGAGPNYFDDQLGLFRILSGYGLSQ